MLPYNDVPSLLPFIHAHSRGLTSHSVVARVEGIETLCIMRFADPRWMRLNLPAQLRGGCSAQVQQNSTSLPQPQSKEGVTPPQALGLRFPVMTTYTGSKSEQAAVSNDNGPPLMSVCMHHGLTCRRYLQALEQVARVTSNISDGSHCDLCACPCSDCEAVFDAANASPAAAASSGTGNAHCLPPGWDLTSVFAHFTDDGAAAVYVALPPRPVSSSGIPERPPPCALASSTFVVMLDGRNTVVPSVAAAAALAAAAAHGADSGDATSRPQPSAATGSTTLAVLNPTALHNDDNISSIGGGGTESSAAEQQVQCQSRRPRGTAGYRVVMSGRGEVPLPPAECARSFDYRARPPCAQPQAPHTASDKQSSVAKEWRVCKCRWVHPGEAAAAAEAKAKAEAKAAAAAAAQAEVETAVSTAKAVDNDESESEGDTESDASDDEGGFAVMF